MTHKDFKELAHYMGADIIFQTAPCAVFVNAAYTVTLDISTDELENLAPLEAADLLAQAAMMTDKEFRGKDPS